MYTLIKAGIASKFELEEYYTLAEANKLYGLYMMDLDIDRAQAEELREGGERK